MGPRVIAPLLTLTADQMRRLKKALQTDAAVEAHHLHEIAIYWNIPITERTLTSRGRPPPTTYVGARQ